MVGPRFLSKLLCFATLLLITAGGIVTTKNVGLAVPDWPTSYGHSMWALPWSMWKGGVLYEHTHRVIASLVGLMSLILAVWLNRIEPRRWVRILAAGALVMVIAQGLLGALTVRLLLPLAVSVSHATMAQIFLVVTIITAYALSRERDQRGQVVEDSADTRKAIWVWAFVSLVIVQLLLGAVMRHGMKHKGGVAIPDFPTAGSAWFPSFDQSMLDAVIDLRDDLVWERGADIDAEVTMADVLVHYLHRIGAALVLIGSLCLTVLLARHGPPNRKIGATLGWLNLALAAQVGLGITTVLTQRGEIFATSHVALGATVLGLATLLAMRCWPVAHRPQEARA